MDDRLSTYPGRIELTDVETGQKKKYDMVMADEPSIIGTPPTKANLLTDESAEKFGLGPDAKVNDMWERVSVPIGGILWFASSTVPDGFLLCDGSSLSTDDYSNLFAVIRYSFGGSGGSFNLPDLRAAFIRGAGSQGGYSATFAQKQEATSINTLPNPNRYLNIQNQDRGASIGNTYCFETGSQISGQAMYVRPFNIALTPIIKY